MKEITANEAWLRSLPKVLLLPAAGWLVFWVYLIIATGNGVVGDLIYLVLGAGIGLLVHGVCYFLIGLPFYRICWKFHPLFWEWPRAIPTGILLGTAAIALMGIFFGRFEFDSLPIGAIYGGLTAVGAVWSRKTL